MKVGPSSNNDYLSIPWVAQICCQLPLSGSVPAHVEEYLDNDEYYNNSGKEEQNRKGCVGDLGETASFIHYESFIF